MEVMINQGAPAVIYDIPDELSISEAALYLKISVSTLRRLIASKAIKTTKISTRIIRISKAELDYYRTKQTS